MKSYTITVNGNVYDVTVEETGSTASAPVRPAAKAAPAGCCWQWPGNGTGLSSYFTMPFAKGSKEGRNNFSI